MITYDMIMDLKKDIIDFIQFKILSAIYLFLQ